MRFWPFPIFRNYETNKALSDIFEKFALAPDLVVHPKGPMVDSHHQSVSCKHGTLRFWDANRGYAWASRGTYTPAGGVKLEWRDEMPSRWAVKKMRERLVKKRVRFPDQVVAA